MPHSSYRKSGQILLGLAVAAGLWIPRSAIGDAADAKKHGPIAWASSYKTALRTAAKAKKPVLIDFYADWCGPCQMMLKTTYKDKQVFALSKKFVPVLVNVDKEPKVATKYGIETIPAVVFLDSKGKVLRKEIGYHDPEVFLKITNEALKQSVTEAKDASVKP